MRHRFIARILAATRAPALAFLLACLALPAAALYKVVGPDGRVTYTDRPPSDSSARISTLGSEGTVTEVPAANALPANLRQATARFPVTLYMADDCPPCDEARALLQQRGVPFTEKRVLSDDDAAALERAVGVRTVPALMVGAQVLRGLSPQEWNAYLDAAGYPRESQLPRNWQHPAATPLVESKAVRSAAAPASAPVRRAPAAALPTPAPAPSPAPGLRF
jgi:glutaredoxin